MNANSGKYCFVLYYNYDTSLNGIFFLPNHSLHLSSVINTLASGSFIHDVAAQTAEP